MVLAALAVSVSDSMANGCCEKEEEMRGGG